MDIKKKSFTKEWNSSFNFFRFGMWRTRWNTSRSSHLHERYDRSETLQIFHRIWVWRWLRRGWKNGADVWRWWTMEWTSAKMWHGKTGLTTFWNVICFNSFWFCFFFLEYFIFFWWNHFFKKLFNSYKIRTK